MPLPKVDIRPRRSMAFFAVLAILMVIASYLFVFALAAACVYLPYLALSLSESPGFYVLALFLFGILIASAMLWSLVPRPDKFVAPGMLLDRSTQPRLYAELDSIAASLNERLPGEVYLIPNPNAFVADLGGVMGFGSRRVMGLGFPLFSALTVSQFRAVLAHEFAHYYGGDTGLGPWVYRTKTAIMRIFENVGSLGQFARIAVLGVMYAVVASVLKAYFKLFLRAINLISRRQEHRADELACLVAGREPLIDGLRSIHGAAMAWPTYWQNEVAPVLGSGTLPALGDGFARFMCAPEVAGAIHKSLEKNLQEPKTSPYDTHPPLRDRISATEKLPTLSAEQDTRPAATLLDQLQTLELHFIEDRIPDIKPGTLKYVSWDEIALRVTIPGWQRAVAVHAADLKGVTAASLPGLVPKFPEIGSRIPDPKGMLLAPNQRTQRAGMLFASALALALLDNRWELDVQPGVFHLRRGTDDWNPFLAVQELMSGKLPRDAWTSKCQALGIAELKLSPEERSAPPQQLAIPAQPTLFDAEAGPAA
jgi:heat shock protein HtpX